MSLDSLRPDLVPFLDPYLPRNNSVKKNPFVTLTYAQSLDSRISKGPGIRTTISDVETKVMTHYLRYHHNAILVGSGTVLADNPGLNCKWHKDDTDTDFAKNSPKPVILDPSQKWRFTGSKMYNLYKSGEGKSPIVVVRSEPKVKEEYVSYLVIKDHKESIFDWELLMKRLHNEFEISSIMVEGGAFVINSLLSRNDIVDSLIITVGSTFLGVDGVEVSPAKPTTLKDIDWWKGKKDAVMAARLNSQD